MEKIEYKLDNFEGPLDLLLYLISKNKLNINDIQLTVLVDQYVEYIRKLQLQDMDIASEFIEMASRLIYLKTVSLLPKHEEAEQLKEEFTAELMEYEHCRKVARLLSGMTDDFDTFIKGPEKIEYDKTYLNIHEKEEILKAYIAAVGRGQRKLPPPTNVFSKIVARKIVSVSSKIVFVLKHLMRGGKNKMHNLFKNAQSRSELVATFLAVLELCKANRVHLDGEGDELEISMTGRKKQ
ncbi:MAG: segregation/condensation protein A [Clostridia bacterium]|nr:segregation/condensation protein A [Clostridia bacterium]